MKTKKLILTASVTLLLSVSMFWACNKDKNTELGPGLSVSNISELQQSESQDAIADKIETGLDNNLDALETNGYSGTSLKSAPVTCVDVAIDSTGINMFPRTITLTYNCTDTVNGEWMSQTGEVQIVVSRIKTGLGTGYYSRQMTFNKFKVETDSMSVIINGTRKLVRTKIKTSLSSDKKNIKMAITDSITANLSFAILYKGVTPDKDTTIVFTRIVNKVRDASLHSKRVGLGHWVTDIANDTITFSGKVEGVNAKGNPYLRNYTIPIKCTFCPFWPHNLVIVSGQIDISSNGNSVGTISYKANECSTTVTATKNGKSKSVERKFGKKFHKWW